MNMKHVMIYYCFITVKLNHFADLTFDEFKDKYLLSTAQNCSATHKKPTQWKHSGRTPPQSKDWRNDGVISPVKDQVSNTWIPRITNMKNVVPVLVYHYLNVYKDHFLLPLPHHKSLSINQFLWNPQYSRTAKMTFFGRYKNNMHHKKIVRHSQLKKIMKKKHILVKG